MDGAVTTAFWFLYYRLAPPFSPTPAGRTTYPPIASAFTVHAVPLVTHSLPWTGSVVWFVAHTVVTHTHTHTLAVATHLYSCHTFPRCLRYHTFVAPLDHDLPLYPVYLHPARLYYHYTRVTAGFPAYTHVVLFPYTHRTTATIRFTHARYTHAFAVYYTHHLCHRTVYRAFTHFWIQLPVLHGHPHTLRYARFCGCYAVTRILVTPRVTLPRYTPHCIPCRAFGWFYTTPFTCCSVTAHYGSRYLTTALLPHHHAVPLVAVDYTFPAGLRLPARTIYLLLNVTGLSHLRTTATIVAAVLHPRCSRLCLTGSAIAELPACSLSQHTDCSPGQKQQRIGETPRAV